MPTLSTVTVGTHLDERTHEPSMVSLFLYNAAIWNPHRIHFDADYTTQIEKHPGIVVDGPLQGDWLSQAVTEWLGDDGELIEFEYSNRRAAYLGERLRAGGAGILKKWELRHGSSTHWKILPDYRRQPRYWRGHGNGGRRGRGTCCLVLSQGRRGS